MVEGLAAGVGAADDADDEGDGEEGNHAEGGYGEAFAVFTIDDGEDETPDGGEAADDEEHQTLGTCTELGREEFGTPEGIEDLWGTAALYTPEDGEEPEACGAVDADGDDDYPCADGHEETEDVDGLVLDLVDELRDDEGDAYDDGPLDAVHPVGLLVGDTTGCLIDVGLEEAHDRSDEVPGEVDGGKEAYRLDGDAVLEEHLDVVEKAVLLTGVLGSHELGTFLQTALEVPCDEGYDEEREEDDARREDVDRIDSEVGSADGVSEGLNPAEEVSARSEEHAEEQDAHRTKAPRHLGDADVASTVVDLGTFGDIGPRCGNADAYGDARDEETAEQHREIDAEHDGEHAEHIDEQIVGEDELAAILVGEESADDGTEGSAQTVGADEVEPAEMYLGEAEIVLPKREATGTSDDGACIKIIGERHGNRAP